MDVGAVENATRLSWRSAPELLINEESLVDVIIKLRTQVQAIERNELLSGTALPAWLLRVLTDVANNADAVLECQGLHEQVNSLQKEILELRHELLLQQSASGSSQGFSPTPYHRLSAGGVRSASNGRPQSIAKGVSRLASEAVASLQDGGGGDANGAPLPPDTQQVNLEQTLKPLWDVIHKQANAFSALKQSFGEAKETVARLQSEIKRRDAVVQARNAKHEGMVHGQVEKLNESLRACVTRNDLIAAEQRIGQQMKSDRLLVLEEVDSRANKIIDDLLASRADQEDINSSNAEQMEFVTRKQARMEDHIIELMKKHTEGQETINEMRVILSDAVARVDDNCSTIDVFQEKVRSFETTQEVVAQLIEDLKKEAENNERRRADQDEHMMEKIGESATILRGELAAVNSVVTELVELNIDSELKALGSKLDIVQLSVSDSTRKLTNVQKQLTTHEDHSKAQFTQVFDSLDRVMSNMSTISEESMRLSYNLNQAVEHGNALQNELTTYKETTDKTINLLHRTTQDVQSGLEKHSKTTENELSMIKNQLFHVEDAHSNMRRDFESTQHDVDQNLRTQVQENAKINGSIDNLFQAREELSARQDAAQAQMMAMQSDVRNEIQQATNRLVAIVDKESDRVEALYRSFQEKQDHFADVVARSSIRNMELTDMNRELDRLCEIFVTECWKFETSARSSSKSSGRESNQASIPGSSLAVTRKLFNERQQQLLAKNCQFFTDLMVARAEYEVLHGGCNKETKNQLDLDELMLDAQVTVVEKMKMKIQTKIMNNKNIGEQFDKSTLDRRELYVETLGNMIDGSMKRRTLCGSNSGGRNGGRKSTAMFGEFSIDDPASGGSFLETQRIIGTSSAVAGSRRKSSTRKQSTMLSSPATGLSSDLDSNRVGFSPGSSYVYRAGFRLPKAAQSPPSSPVPMTALSEHGDSSIFLSSTLDPEAPTLDPLQGWTGDDGSGGGLSKSISLPALRQQ